MRGELPPGLIDEVLALSEDERLELMLALKETVATEMPVARGEQAPGCRPRCGGEHIVKKGKDGAGRPRYLCKSCNRTFGASTTPVMGMTKPGVETWTKHAEGMANGDTLRQLADQCEVTLKTSWLVRMRLLEAMGKHIDDFRSGPDVSVEVDGTMPRESFSGNQTKGSFDMPRPSRRSGKDLHVRGVSGQLVCVLCAANDRGDVHATILGRAHGSSLLIETKLEGVIEPGTTVATDDLAAYDRALYALGCEHEAGPSKPSRGERGLGLADEAHRKPGLFLRPFRGVATRRLERYLQWLVWTCQFKATAADRRDLVTREAMTGEYDATIRSIFDEGRFDMLWWECRGSAA